MENKKINPVTPSSVAKKTAEAVKASPELKPQEKPKTSPSTPVRTSNYKARVARRPMTPRSHNKEGFNRHGYRDIPVDKAPAIQGNPDALRIVPLGGFEEIGKNMMFLEYKNEIVIIDAGVQFPEESTPGIDFIIPNVSYLEGKKANIKALIITHGHYDHTHAISYVITKLGNPTIFCAAITKEMILRRHEEFPNLAKLDIEVVSHGSKVNFSKSIQGEFFSLDHTVPDTLGTFFKTPIGNVVHFTDFKFDYDESGRAIGLEHFAMIGKQGIHTLIIDSTNAGTEGYSLSERIVEKNLETLFASCQGRIVVATFSSLLARLREIIKIAEKLNRKVFIGGYSMKANIQIAQNLGYMKFSPGLVNNIEDVEKYKDNNVLIICTGAQGEENASLMRIANGEHKQVRVKEGDSFILSSSIVPGNERGVQILKDNLTRQGGIVFQSSQMDIHSSGHAPREEIKEAIRLIKPKYLIPAHGYYFMRAANRENGFACGIPKANTLLLDNGDVAELTMDSAKITKEKVEASSVFVDGLGVGDVGEIVLRDRRMLSQEGMIVIITTISRHDGRILKNPDIISRGFIYLKENQEILDEMRRRLKTVIDNMRPQGIDPEYLKTIIRDQIGAMVYKKTKRRPMILPVVIEI